MQFIYPGEQFTLDSATRKPENGCFASLPHGVTHYELSGVEADEAIVLICGFSVPYYIFDPVFEALRLGGLPVLRYDLLGRGWSDRPRIRYGIEAFLQQLRELLDALNINRASLVGLSMGGPIAASFTARYPTRVRRLVLIDPAGARDLPLSWFLRLCSLPVLGEMAMLLPGTGAILRAVAKDFFDETLVADFLQRYRTQMQFAGFRRALLSTLRAGMLESCLETYEEVGMLGLPTLLIWGMEDHTVPFEHSILIRQAMPHAKFEAIQDAGHVPHYEQPALVNRVLAEFLQ